MMTILDIARLLGVGQQMIRGIEKRYLKTDFSKPKLRRLTALELDEISIRKGQS